MEKLLDLRLRKSIAIEEALGGKRREVQREKFAQGGLVCHREALTEILSKEYYSRLSVLSYKYNKHSEWMTKPDHGASKVPRQIAGGSWGCWEEEAVEQTPRQLLGTVGDTREEGAGESRFLFLLVSSKPQWRSLGKATGLWALVLLSSGHHRSYQWPWRSWGTLCHG